MSVILLRCVEHEDFRELVNMPLLKNDCSNGLTVRGLIHELILENKETIKIKVASLYKGRATIVRTSRHV